MERTCQASYPLNSENASPPGTFKVYLSWAAWADMALPPKALTSAVRIATVSMRLLFVTRSPFVGIRRDKTIDIPLYDASGDEPGPLSDGVGRRGRSGRPGAARR